MWIQVRTMDGKKSIRMDGLSKLTKIEDLRALLVDKFDAPVSQQRLFHRGKQMVDGHTLFDYNVGLNEIVQIMVKQPEVTVPKAPELISPIKKTDKENEGEIYNSSSSSDNNQNVSKYFKVGDRIDGKDPIYGAWFEAEIKNIRAVSPTDKQVLQNHTGDDQSEPKGTELPVEYKVEDEGLLYKIVFEDYEDCEDPVEVSLHSVRPRARKNIKFEDVKIDDVVMVNYNIEEPIERGFWYDCFVTDLKEELNFKYLIGTIIMGPDNTKLENCKIKFIDEIFAIEKTLPLNVENSATNSEGISRPKVIKCNYCKDIPTRKCKMCNCNVCGGKDAPEKQIMCDECDLAYHLWCLNPPLTELPDEDDWYCPKCKNDKTEIVQPGEKLKASKNKAKMASANSSATRDWGKGMACVGRTKECTIVPPNHFGPIPGVEVGTMWKFRVQVSETGVHRPHVAGIHGRAGEGAYSIVLSGGYEDDLDEGEEFKYTGSGGRDLSGNKRCAEQSCDQTLTRMNQALASNCDARLNNKGAEAKDWAKGKPVRVVRNCKGRKHSEYCPEEGNRYDGIYKVVKYWPEKGKSGFLVWRYLLRRDDPTPAPWTKAGKTRIKQLGLTMQYPEGYLESLAEKEKQNSENCAENIKKRPQSEDTPRPKKKKKSIHTLSTEIEKQISEDKKNKKLWDECLEVVKEGSQAFLKKVEDVFSCICCQEVVYDPITTVCSHNICKSCLDRSFKAKVFTCPMCRQDLEKRTVNMKNEFLQKALLSLFPGYDASRK